MAAITVTQVPPPRSASTQSWIRDEGVGEEKLLRLQFGVYQGVVLKEETHVIQQMLGKGSSGPPGLERGHWVLTEAPHPPAPFAQCRQHLHPEPKLWL